MRYVIFLMMCFIVLNCAGTHELHAQKDPFDSFDQLDIGIVVQDTSSLDATYESPFYDAMANAGMNIHKIDTTSMDAIYFDSRGWPWDTLDAVVICFGTDSAAIDTSLAQGIGEVPVMVMEPFYWSDFSPVDSNDGTIVNDSFRVKSTDYITQIFTLGDSLEMMTSSTSAYTHTAVGVDLTLFSNLAAGSQDSSTFGMDSTWGVLRIMNGFVDGTVYNNDQGTAWTVFNRAIARLSGSYLDSLFTIGMSVNADKQADASERPYKNHLELNGHEVLLVSVDSLNGLNAADSSWSVLNAFLHQELDAGATGIDSVLDNITKIMVGVNTTNGIGEEFLDSLDLASPLFTSTRGVDSLVIKNNTSKITNIYTLGDTIYPHDAGTDGSFSQPAASGISNLLAIIHDGSEVGVTSRSGMTVRNDARYIYVPAFNANISSSMTLAGWTLFDQTMGWLLDTEINRATNVTITALSTDSVKITWEDNSDSEDGYSVYIYDPDGAYWAHLAANTTSDTLYHLWPPNSRVIADVAAVSGTDTLFSATGRDTAWSLAAVPPKMFQQVLNDTTVRFYLNGYIFDERFDDEDFTADPLWTLSDSVEVDTLRRQLRSSGGTGGYITTAFEADRDTLNDAVWDISFKFSSANNDTPFIRFDFMQDASFANGYFVKIIAADSIQFWTTIVSSNSKLLDMDGQIGENKITSWHTLEIWRDVEQSPQDTTVTFFFYLDGDSIGSVSSITHWASDSMRVQLSNTETLQDLDLDLRVDNIQVSMLRPSGNHDSTQYAIQDSVSGLYVHDSPDTLRTTENWRTYREWGRADGDTVTSLPADSLVRMRAKARNEWGN